MNRRRNLPLLALDGTQTSPIQGQYAQDSTDKGNRRGKLPREAEEVVAGMKEAACCCLRLFAAAERARKAGSGEGNGATGRRCIPADSPSQQTGKQGAACAAQRRANAHPCAFSRAVLLSRRSCIVGALALAGANASPGAAPGRALFCQPSRGQRGGSIGAACGALAPLGGAPGKAQGGLQWGTIPASDR